MFRVGDKVKIRSGVSARDLGYYCIDTNILHKSLTILFYESEVFDGAYKVDDGRFVWWIPVRFLELDSPIVDFLKEFQNV